MLKIQVSLIPPGKRAEKLYDITIANVFTEYTDDNPLGFGDYAVRITSENYSKETSVKHFDRRRGALALLRRALGRTVCKDTALTAEDIRKNQLRQDLAIARLLEDAIHDKNNKSK